MAKQQQTQNATPQETIKEPKGNCLMSKTKFREIEKQFNDKIGSAISEELMDIIARVLNFDVDAKVYNKEAQKRRHAKIKKISEDTGVMITEISGQKKYYENHKKECHRRVSEYKKRIREERKEKFEEAEMKRRTKVEFI